MKENKVERANRPCLQAQTFKTVVSAREVHGMVEPSTPVQSRPQKPMKPMAVPYAGLCDDLGEATPVGPPTPFATPYSTPYTTPYQELLDDSAFEEQPTESAAWKELWKSLGTETECPKNNETNRELTSAAYNSNTDPVLTPEELKIHNLAPRTYDYLYKVPEAFVGQLVVLDSATAKANIDYVMRNDFSFYSRFPGEVLGKPALGKNGAQGGCES